MTTLRFKMVEEAIGRKAVAVASTGRTSGGVFRKTGI